MRKILFASLIMLFSGSLVHAQADNSALLLSMDQPQVNKKIGFQYTGQLSQKENCKSTLYYTVKDKIYASSIGTANVGKKLLGSFTLPDSAQAFALVFQVGDTIDNNKNLGYVYNLYQDGKPIAGTYASGASFFGFMSSLLGTKRDFDKVTSLYEKAFKTHPEEQNIYAQQYLKASLYSKNAAATLDRLKAEWKFAIAEKAPEDSLMRRYSNLSIFDRAHTDTYTKQMVALYPKGLLAARKAGYQLFALKNADSIIAQYQRLKGQYPQIDKALNQQQYNLVLARKYLAAQDYQNFQIYADKLTNNNMKASIYNSAAWPLAERGNKDSLTLAASLAQKAVDAAIAMKKDKPSYFTEKRWGEIWHKEYGEIADTYAYVLYQQGKIKEALALQEKAVTGLKADGDMNQRLVQYLITNQDYTQALDKASAFVKAGKANAKMRELARVAFAENNGFETYYATLEAAAKEKMIAEIKAKMLQQPGHSFTLKDLAGKSVSLDSLRGKVVVLDFWATWCGPCKMSFPGMQLAVDKYKNDSNVVFLFIDTWEKQPTTAQRVKAVKALMTANNYSFHVLLDSAVTQDKSKYDVVSAYQVTGIPTKFVLDKKGDIRFKAIGFDGNTPKLAEELSIMIELAKKE